MERSEQNDDIPTLATSYTPQQTHSQEITWSSYSFSSHNRQGNVRWHGGPPKYHHRPFHAEREGWRELRSSFSIDGLGSTGKGILIGMLSAFGSAALVALIIATVYFFRYTSRGRIFLDRIGRPGEYDDEQAFLREEEEAVEEMDELERGEYFRAKGKIYNTMMLWMVLLMCEV
jgi:hypothetical protein